MRGSSSFRRSRAAPGVCRDAAAPARVVSAKKTACRVSQNAEWAAGFCWTEMGGRSPGAPTGLRFLTQRVHHRAGKGASWSTHSVLGRLRKSFVCLRAHSECAQTDTRFRDSPWDGWSDHSGWRTLPSPAGTRLEAPPCDVEGCWPLPTVF